MKILDREIEIIVENIKSGTSNKRKTPFTMKQYRESRSKLRYFLNSGKVFNTFFKKKSLALEAAYLTFICEKNMQLVLTLNQYFGKGKMSKRHYRAGTYSHRALVDFSHVFVVISNNYITMQRLIFSGMDFQANVIFRNTIELTELCFCLLHKESFLKFVREEKNNSKNEILYKTIKYKSIKKTSSDVIEYIKSRTNPLPPKFWDEYMKTREHYYEETSNHVHSNFITLMRAACVPMIDSDSMLMNVGGFVNKGTKALARQIAFYDALSYMILMILMIDQHNLYFKKFGKSTEYLTVLSMANWNLLKHML